MAEVSVVNADRAVRAWRVKTVQYQRLTWQMQPTLRSMRQKRHQKTPYPPANRPTEVNLLPGKSVHATVTVVNASHGVSAPSVSPPKVLQLMKRRPHCLWTLCPMHKRTQRPASRTSARLLPVQLRRSMRGLRRQHRLSTPN